MRASREVFQHHARAVALAGLACWLLVFPPGFSGALPQEAGAPRGQVLHILAGEAVVVDMQARITRVLASNEAVIRTVGTSPTQIVVEGKAPGNSSLILWDEGDHSRTLDVVVDGALPQEAGAAEGQVLHIFVGKAVVVNMQARITRVLASNDSVIQTVGTSPTQIVVEGKAPGTSSLIMWDENEHSQILDVVVDVDAAGLRTAIEHAYPDQRVDVQAESGRIILSGTISDPHISDDLMKMAAFYAKDIVNTLTVEPSRARQVLLEVTFAEIDRSRIEELGINLLSVGGLNTLGAVSTQQFGPPSGAVGATSGATLTGTSPAFATTPLSVSSLLNIFLFRPDLNLGATIQDLEQKAILQILSQPNLLASNGQKASFLAGGEFPYPVVQGGQNIGVVTIQFRPYGIKLEFTAFIGKDDVVRLHVAPEVSTLDYSNAISISGFLVPAFSTRRAETEIELKNGQSFGIAGLLDHRATVNMSKIPGIGDIPVLGQLFRSKNVNRSTDELMVLVTPHIVDPVHNPGPAPKLAKPPVQWLDVPKYDQGLPEHTSPETPAQPPKPK